MAIPFLQAKFYSKTRFGNHIQIGIIHTMETPETKGRAKQVWQWFWGKTSPKASAHYMFDATSVEQSVKEADTAWAVDDWNLNTKTVNLELSGEASQTPAQWADAYSLAELKLVIQEATDISKRNKLAIIHLTDSQIRAIYNGNKTITGWCGHNDITRALSIRGGHSDPGGNFPWVLFLAQVKFSLIKMA